MTETTEPAATSEKSEEPADAIKAEMQRISVIETLMNLVEFAKPADAALGKAIAANSPDGDMSQGIRRTSLLDTLIEWVQESPVQAAAIVLSAVYLANTHTVIQASKIPPTEPEPTPDAEQVAAE